MKISALEKVNVNQIKSILTENDKTLFYCSPEFVSMLCEVLSASQGWIVAEDNECLQGFLPFVYKDGPIGKIFNSLPYYGSNGGVVVRDSNLDLKKDLIEYYYQFAEANKAASATMIENPLDSSKSFYQDFARPTHTDVRTSQITNLPPLNDIDNLMGIFENPRPRNIRRAIKEKIEVSYGHHENISFLYRTHLKNMQAIKGKAKSKQFFDIFPKFIRDENWRIYVASLDGKPISALLLFYFNNTVEYFTPVIIDEYKSLQPLALIIYKAMQDSIHNGFKYWNWGGTWKSQTGVYNFKRKWGSQNSDYKYYIKVYSNKVYDKNVSFFEKYYDGFYVIPFDKLTRESDL